MVLIAIFLVGREFIACNCHYAIINGETEFFGDYFPCNHQHEKWEIARQAWSTRMSR